MKSRRKIGYIAAFYVLTFVVTFFVANYMLNYERTHPVKNQGETTLIRLYVKNSNLKINEMDAYVDEMDPSYLRLSVTPVSETKKVTLQMSEPVTNVKTIKYELLDDTNTHLYEEGECPEIQRVEGARQTEITFNTNLKENTEYCLNLTVEDDQGNTYYYYTRVVYGTNLKMYDKLKFVMDFHTASFSKSATTDLAEYMSYSSNSNSNDFRKVTIYTDSETVTWGDLAPEVISDVDITVLHADSQTAEVELVYEITANDEEGNDYQYQVREFFDVSTTGSSMNLIGYTRSMDEKLDEKSFFFDDGELRLGLVDEDEIDLIVYGKEEPEEEIETETESEEVQKEEEEYNTYIGFVADGALWVYNTKDNMLTQAFGFEHKNQMANRESSYLNHGVQVLRTKENGDMIFAVYGYMYNGDNEGRFGIQINEYNRVAGTYSEVVFIPYDKSFELLHAGMHKMGFVDQESRFYVYLEDKVYQIDTITREYAILLEDAESKDCEIAGDGKSVVISHRDDSGRISEIEWANLDSGEVRRIMANGKSLYMIGILSGNLVYGVSSSEVQNGRMDVLYIVDFNLNKLKEYTVPDGYISDAEVREGNVLQIWRRKSDHTDMESDYLIYNEPRLHDIEVYNVYHELRMRESWLSTETIVNDMPIVHYARGIESYNQTEVAFHTESERYMGYYVKYNDELIKCGTFKEAYTFAYENECNILNYQGQLLVRPVIRDNQKNLNGPDIGEVGDDILEQQREVLEWLMTFEKKSGEPVMNGSSMFENLRATFPEYEFVNMSGIPLNRAITMISHGYPLIIKNSEGTWCVASGYSSGYIEVADPKDGTVVRYNRDSVIEGVASSGNVIYSYLR